MRVDKKCINRLHNDSWMRTEKIINEGAINSLRIWKGIWWNETLHWQEFPVRMKWLSQFVTWLGLSFKINANVSSRLFRNAFLLYSSGKSKWWTTLAHNLKNLQDKFQTNIRFQLFLSISEQTSYWYTFFPMEIRQ